MAETKAHDLHKMPVGEVTEGFDDEVCYLERVTVKARVEAVKLFMEAGHLAADEVDPQAIHMRWVEDGNDPEIEANPVPDIPCWLECAADHPDAVPFWKDAP